MFGRGIFLDQTDLTMAARRALREEADTHDPQQHAAQQANTYHEPSLTSNSRGSSTSRSDSMRSILNPPKKSPSPNPCDGCWLLLRWLSVSCCWLLIVLMCWRAAVLVRCVVAWAVRGVLFEPKSRSGGRSATASDLENKKRGEHEKNTTIWDLQC